MQIRPVEKSDLSNLARLDRGPDPWDEVRLEDYVSAFGVLKLAEEGKWLLGWIAYRRVPKLLIVDRLVVLEDHQTMCSVAIRLVRHLASAAEGCEGLDIALAEDKLDLIKTLVSQGFSAGLIKDFYTEGGVDAVALHKKLH